MDRAREYWNPLIETLPREKLKIATDLSFEMEAVKSAGLPRYTLKSARFKDLWQR